MYTIGILTDSGYLYRDIWEAAEKAGYSRLGNMGYIKGDTKIAIDHTCHIPKVFIGKEIDLCIIYTFDPLEYHQQLYQSTIDRTEEFIHVNPYGTGMEPILKLTDIFSKREQHVV